MRRANNNSAEGKKLAAGRLANFSPFVRAILRHRARATVLARARCRRFTVGARVPQRRAPAAKRPPPQAGGGSLGSLSSRQGGAPAHARARPLVASRGQHWSRAGVGSLGGAPVSRAPRATRDDRRRQVQTIGSGSPTGTGRDTHTHNWPLAAQCRARRDASSSLAAGGRAQCHWPAGRHTGPGALFKLLVWPRAQVQVVRRPARPVSRDSRVSRRVARASRVDRRRPRRL